MPEDIRDITEPADEPCEAPPDDGNHDRPGRVCRRVFVRTSMGVVGACYAAAFGYPLYRYLATPSRKAATEAAVKEVALPAADKLLPNSAMIFKFGARPALLIHHADGTWVAMSAVCTHLGCTVQFEPDQQRIHCGCHGGVYDMRTGQNVSGPPPKPLVLFHVEVSDGKVTVSRA